MSTIPPNDTIANDAFEELLNSIALRAASSGAAALDGTLHGLIVRAYHQYAARGRLLEIATEQIATLTKGPYDVVACRGHWHLTVDGVHVLSDAGDVLDEATARREAAKENARFRAAKNREDGERWRKLVALAEMRDGGSVLLCPERNVPWVIRSLHPSDWMYENETYEGETLDEAIDKAPSPESTV